MKGWASLTNERVYREARSEGRVTVAEARRSEKRPLPATDDRSGRSPSATWFESCGVLDSARSASARSANIGECRRVGEYRRVGESREVCAPTDHYITPVLNRRAPLRHENSDRFATPNTDRGVLVFSRSRSAVFRGCPRWWQVPWPKKLSRNGHVTCLTRCGRIRRATLHANTLSENVVCRTY